MEVYDITYTGLLDLLAPKRLESLYSFPAAWHVNCWDSLPLVAEGDYLLVTCPANSSHLIQIMGDYASCGSAQKMIERYSELDLSLMLDGGGSVAYDYEIWHVVPDVCDTPVLSGTVLPVWKVRSFCDRLRYDIAPSGIDERISEFVGLYEISNFERKGATQGAIEDMLGPVVCVNLPNRLAEDGMCRACLSVDGTIHGQFRLVKYYGYGPMDFDLITTMRRVLDARSVCIAPHDNLEVQQIARSHGLRIPSCLAIGEVW